MKIESFTLKVVFITLQFFSGVISLPWWIITYYMITGTLHGKDTASVCIPIGIAMFLLAILSSTLLVFFQRKCYSKKTSALLASLIPFSIGIGIFLLCAFFGIK